MRLKTVRVENFKCIEDSEEFSIAGVTCLVGKNESGKSALLEALHKLNPSVASDANFESLDYPRRHYAKLKEDHSYPNVLTTLWELDTKDRDALSAVLGPSAVTTPEAVAKKGYDNVIRWVLPANEQDVITYLVGKSSLSTSETQLISDATTIDDLLKKIKAIPPQSAQTTAFIAKVNQEFPENDITKAIAKILNPRIPKLLLFANYDRMPGEMSLDLLLTKKGNNTTSVPDKIFLALLDLAGTSAEELQKIGRFEQLQAQLEGVSNQLTEQIFTYWSQNNNLEVEFHFDHSRPNDPAPFNAGYVFRTRIRNNRHKVTVGFDERSAGFVWFFSFLAWFSQVRKNYGDNLFILLDEPALNLHAKAQGDFLRYVDEKLKPNFQVIYTTHSPFMVDTEKIISVRTVEDVVIKDKVNGTEEVKGTKVGDRVFSTDRDTIFPLQAALGYDITQSLFVGKHTLLVEGPSDLMYLKWFSNELANLKRTTLDLRWVISPSGGIDKIASFVTLFGGNRLHVAVLTDFHYGDKRKIRDLRESKLLQAGHVLSAEAYAGTNEADIEDLLGRTCYTRLVNHAYGLSGANAMDTSSHAGAPVRVVKEVEAHFALLPPNSPEFDHFEPASYLMEHGPILRGVPELAHALGRFEQLFTDLNALLPIR